MKDLKQKTVQAAGWVVGMRVVSQIVSFFFGIVLARLLVPDDFGLIAMILVFTGFAGLLSDVGLGAALIQKRDVRDEHFSSVFWVNLLLGCLIALAIYLLSPWLAVFYARPEVEDISKVLSIGFIMGAVALVPRTRLIKALLFKYLSLIDLCAMVVAGAVAIYMASTGFGYWSLVVNVLLQQLVSLVLIWLFGHWLPAIRINISAVRELLGFSASVFGTQMLQYIAKNVDKMLLGKYMGGVSLGLYDKAHSMMLFPLQNVSHVIGTVMFPSLSLIQADKDRVRNVYLRCVGAIALLTFPMMVGLFVVAETFVMAVLGPHWLEMVPVLQVFCIAGFVSSIVTVTGALYRSQGKAALQLKVNLITQPLKILGVVAGLPGGVIGVATGFTVASYVNGFITMAIAGRLVGLKISTTLASLVPVLLSAMIMGGLVWLIKPVFDIEKPLILLFVQILTGGLVYLGILTVMRLKIYLDVTDTLGGEFIAWRQRKKAEQM